MGRMKSGGSGLPFLPILPFLSVPSVRERSEETPSACSGSLHFVPKLPRP